MHSMYLYALSVYRISGVTLGIYVKTQLRIKVMHIFEITKNYLDKEGQFGEKHHFGLFSHYKTQFKKPDNIPSTMRAM